MQYSCKKEKSRAFEQRRGMTPRILSRGETFTEISEQNSVRGGQNRAAPREKIGRRRNTNRRRKNLIRLGENHFLNAIAD